MNIGIVTTWFERGAAYVSKQYMEVLAKEHDIFIYARSGESYAIGNKAWDLPNVYWSAKINSPFAVTVMNKSEFSKWVRTNKIDAILFNEQHWWEPLLWCQELNVKTIAYIDYYTEQTVPLFGIYDMLICNTKKHIEAFKWHKGARFIPWGTNTELFQPVVRKREYDEVVFFHSCGMNPRRKGTDLLLKALRHLKNASYKLIIHSQINLREYYPDLIGLIDEHVEKQKLEIILKTVEAPGLYHLGDMYVYPSRLDGIGLTIAEALSSGLGVIVPDSGPMNEFVNEDFGRKVKVEKYFSRQDGYYWPQNEIAVENLAEIMDYYATNYRDIHSIKTKAREYAVANLDWRKNSNIINLYISDLLKSNSQENKDKEILQIKAFEKSGLRKYNKYVSKYPTVFNLFNQIIRRK